MEKYPFKDFAEGKVRVYVANRDEARLLMAECEKRGIRWISENNATVHYYSRCYIFTVQIRKSSPDRALMFNPNFVPHQTTITLDQLQLDDPKPEKRYQILIESDGDTTTAKMIVNGKEVKSAQAKRNPDDKPNWKIGAEMAFARLWGRGEKKPAVKEFKRNAKVGEYIKLIRPEFSFNKKGDILLVSDIAPSGNPIVEECDHPRKAKKETKRWCYREDCYVVLEGYKPKK